MASATATAKPESRSDRRRWLPGSRLGRLIIALNLIGLAVLIAGALVLNEFRRGLIEARTESLRTQGELIAKVIVIGATQGSPEPSMDAERAAELLQALFIPTAQRVRLFDREGRLVSDSYLVADRVDQRALPPARKRDQLRLQLPASPPQARAKIEAEARQALAQEVAQALSGQRVAKVRKAVTGEQVVSVSLPIQNVKAVLGVLTLEAGDVDKIIAAQRRALMPFILVAVATTILTSLLLSAMIAQPVLRLARAADRVRLSRARAISLPDLAKRDDELGDLTRALESMTDALSTRIDAIERFAADVAHEIRNPLTSIRSAIDTLPLVKEDKGRERLLAILQQDVNRLDRLVTDISNASRLDAELSREPPRAFDLVRLLQDIAGLYNASGRPGDAEVVFVDAGAHEPLLVSGREGPIGQVFRNLIDNARSFSPPGGKVCVRIGRMGRRVRAFIDDDGPGMPPENLETVFERFYTSRPKGTAFGNNSGLGLSIARQIVEAHDGRIWAENREDALGRVIGARFGVEFPEVRA
ncbi:MAG: histidine kinase [Caulobacteraceae bacterium]|nr:histidine kinase [Caulobacteraceae bacterium]